MDDARAAVKIVGPSDANEGFLGSIGVRFMIDGAEAGRALLARRAPDVPAGARRAATPPHARGRVQLRARGTDGRAARRRRRRGRPGRPGPQAAQPVAHVLERRRRAVPDPRDHRPGGLRALLRRARRHGRRRRRPTPRRSRALNDRYGLEMQPETVPELRRALRRPDRRAALGRLGNPRCLGKRHSPSRSVTKMFRIPAIRPQELRCLDAVRVAHAMNESEAPRLIQGLLREEGIPSSTCSAPGRLRQLPEDMLAAGPREVLVPADRAAEARDLLDAPVAEPGDQE